MQERLLLQVSLPNRELPFPSDNLAQGLLV